MHAVGLDLRLRVARGWRARLLGLAGLRRLGDGVGLLIPGCRSVHTFGMRFPIDVVFVEWLDSNKDAARVLAVRARLRTARVATCSCADAVIELAAAEAERLALYPAAEITLRRQPPARSLP